MINHDKPISAMNLMKFINHYQHSFTLFLGRPVALLAIHPAG